MSRIHDGVAIRKQRIDRLIEIIEKHQNDLSENQIIGLFYRQTGNTLVRIREYLEELETVGIIERLDGKIRMLK
jgi:hypothetical protein